MLRRSLFGVAPLGLLAFSTTRAALAGRGAVSARRVAAWIDDYADAWINKDATAAGELFSEDAIYEAVPGVPTQTFVGREAIRRYWTDITAPQSNVTIQRGEPMVDGGRGVVELWVTMRLPAVNPLGDQMVTLVETNVLSFDHSGLCRRNVEYWNLQLGKLTPPEGWGAGC